jgi:hypothetical protein
MTRTGVQLAVELARRRIPIKAHALSSLAARAEDYGVRTVVEWIEEDPGLALVPSWQWWRVAGWAQQQAGEGNAMATEQGNVRE